MTSLARRALRKLLTPVLWNYTSAEYQCANVGFSQFGEDIMCHYLFADEFKGFYVDVGAFHPLTFSNTYAFYRRGWRGLVVEPNPEYAPLFERFRPRDTFIPCAVGAGGGTVEMAMFKDPTFNCTADQANHVPEKWRKDQRRLQVPLKALSTILSENSVATVDFLTVDCEGNDQNVLRSNDWTRWKPKVICVEDHAQDWQRSEIVSSLAALGYSLKYRAVFSSIFVLNDFINSSASRGCVAIG